MPLSTPIPTVPDPYATHQPVLRSLPRVRRILELGAGWYSTPLLAAMCDELASYDESQHWAEALTAAAAGRYAVHHATPDILALCERELLADLPDIAFLDSGTFRLGAPAARGKAALLCLAAGVRFVVCHDTEPDVRDVYGWRPALAMATYHLHFLGWYGPRDGTGRPIAWTSVLSMVDDLAEVRRNLRSEA